MTKDFHVSSTVVTHVTLKCASYSNPKKQQTNRCHLLHKPLVNERPLALVYHRKALQVGYPRLLSKHTRAQNARQQRAKATKVDIDGRAPSYMTFAIVAAVSSLSQQLQSLHGGLLRICTLDRLPTPCRKRINRTASLLLCVLLHRSQVQTTRAMCSCSEHH